MPRERGPRPDRLLGALGIHGDADQRTIAEPYDRNIEYLADTGPRRIGITLRYLPA